MPNDNEEQPFLLAQVAQLGQLARFGLYLVSLGHLHGPMAGGLSLVESSWNGLGPRLGAFLASPLVDAWFPGPHPAVTLGTLALDGPQSHFVLGLGHLGLLHGALHGLHALHGLWGLHGMQNIYGSSGFHRFDGLHWLGGLHRLAGLLRGGDLSK